MLTLHASHAVLTNSLVLFHLHKVSLVHRKLALLVCHNPRSMSLTLLGKVRAVVLYYHTMIEKNANEKLILLKPSKYSLRRSVHPVSCLSMNS